MNRRKSVQNFVKKCVRMRPYGKPRQACIMGILFTLIIRMSNSRWMRRVENMQHMESRNAHKILYMKLTEINHL
jgi:hypothetical protein